MGSFFIRYTTLSSRKNNFARAFLKHFLLQENSHRVNNSLLFLWMIFRTRWYCFTLKSIPIRVWRSKFQSIFVRNSRLFHLFLFFGLAFIFQTQFACITNRSVVIDFHILLIVLDNPFINWANLKVSFSCKLHKVVFRN